MRTKYIKLFEDFSEEEAAELMDLGLISQQEYFNQIERGDPVPVWALNKFVDDQRDYIRHCVALNSNATPAILAKLAQDQDLGVRQAVACNANTESSVLSNLANDKSIVVRNAVAENPNTPFEALGKLAKDSIDQVRRAAISNPSYRGPRA